MSVSVAELLPGTGSVAAEVTVAVLLSVPVAAALIVHDEVYVTDEPGGIVMPELLILPANGPAVFPVAPLAGTLVVEHVKIAGNVSATVTLVAVLGPGLDAVIVYVTDPPGTAVVTPSVFVIERSACGVSVSVSVAELLPGTGSVTAVATVAVLLSVPVAAALIVHEEVYVTDEPGGIVIPVLFMLPANGPAVFPVAPPAGRLVVEHVKIAGNVSATVTLVAVLGPGFEAVIVYVTELPGTAVVTPSVFVIERSACAVSVTVGALAELFNGFGSVVTDATVEVLFSEPVAEASIVHDAL